MNLEDFFEKVYVINLDRRPDRYEEFLAGVPKDWPFHEIERVSAIDGKKCKHPEWWRQGNGAWGCYRTHLRLIEEALNNDVESILLLEDDCTFVEGFKTRVLTFLRDVPGDWGMLYLGGQHLKAHANPPLRISDRVYRPYNVNRTHAWAIHKRLMRKVYRWIQTDDWYKGHHIDHHLGRLHQRRDDPIYCPDVWLCGQGAGQSNISGRTTTDRLWPAAKNYSGQELPPFVGVVGLHASGSSCVAGVLYYLGVHMGNTLVGYHGKPPVNGGEAIGLANLCDKAIPKFATSAGPSTLGNWIRSRRKEAKAKKKLAGGKYPTMVALTNELRALGDDLWVINVNRPIADSIASVRKRPDLIRRKVNMDDVEKQQHWLVEKRRELQPHVKRWLNVDFYTLLANPTQGVQRIADFLKLTPTREQLEAAVSFIRPELQHERLDLLARSSSDGNPDVPQLDAPLVSYVIGPRGERLTPVHPAT